jgi:small subunit ribosomal protein S18
MRRKNCLFCADGEEILDWKNVEVLSGFVTEHHKIVPRRISYTCAKHQRKLTTEIKRSRQAALMGYTLLVD